MDLYRLRKVGRRSVCDDLLLAVVDPLIDWRLRVPVAGRPSRPRGVGLAVGRWGRRRLGAADPGIA